MEATIRKPSAGTMVMALLMVFFGSLMFGYGYFGVSEWRSEGPALIACNTVLLVTGTLVVGSALWLLGSWGRSRPALWIGGTTIVASGTVLATAAAIGILPCSGPA